MAALNHGVVLAGISDWQLRCVPLRVQQRVKLQMRAIGVVCARRGGKVEVGKRGGQSSERGDGGEDDAVKVAEDSKLRLELKVKIGGLECNARKAKGGEGVGRLRGHTIGVDLGDAKTGLSVSLGGYAPRPLTVSFVWSCNLCDAVCEQVDSHPFCSCGCLLTHLSSVCEAKACPRIRRRPVEV